MAINQQTAEAILLYLLKLEDRSLSGTIRNLNDGGGLTRFGITSRFDNQLIPPDYWHASTADALRMAVEFYQTQFWNKLNLSQLDDVQLAASVLSYAVNAGLVTGAKKLEQVLGTFQDGVIGPKDIAAANAQPGAEDAFIESLVSFYYNLVKSDPTKEQFLVGWISRARARYPTLPS